MPDSSRLNDSPLARWRELTWRDRGRLLGLALLLPLIDLSLRAFGIHRTQRLLRIDGEAVACHTPGADAIADADRLAALAGIAGRRGVYANTCLRQALAIQWWLRRRGLPAELRIGAQVNDGNLQAHAWVELDGHALAQAHDLPPIFVATKSTQTR
jgi:hypothetical protein